MVILIFFLSLEVICRIGMAIRYRDASFLKYGLVHFSRFDLRAHSSAAADENDYFGIVVYGGSVAYGWDVERNETFPHQLENILNERLHTDRVKVSNKGAPAQTSYKTVTDILTEGDDNLHRKNRNRIYIVYTGINDALRLYTASFGTMHLQPEEWAYNKFELTKIQRLYYLLKKTMLCFSIMDDLLVKYKIKGENFAGKRLSNSIYNTMYKLPIKEADIEKQIQILLDRYRDNLITIINYCRLYGIHLIFGREAVNKSGTYGDMEMDRFMKYYNLTYEQMERIAKQEGILYIDDHDYFSKLPIKEKYFRYAGRDWCHYTPEGNRIVAERFADAILKNNLIGK